MFKVADYLIQAQSFGAPPGHAQLRPLDTRGDGTAAYSLLVLLSAIGQLVRGRMTGKLAGVHVNMAERLSLFRKSAVVVSCKALGIPVVLHLHAAQLHHFYRALPKPLQLLTRWVFSLPASCIVLGKSSERFVVDELKVKPERVEIVINGVPEPTEHRRPVQLVKAIQRVLFVGNLSERKGVTDLLNALALPGFDASKLEVTFVGGGDVGSYQQKAQSLGLSRWTKFHGWADQKQVAQLMARSDVLILPSYDEGLPLVILEALANSLAVICTPVGEIPQALTDGVNALFVQPGDVPGIAAGLQVLISQPELRQQLATNGRALYEARFSLSRFFANIATIHQQHFGVSGQALVPLPVPAPLAQKEAY